MLRISMTRNRRPLSSKARHRFLLFVIAALAASLMACSQEPPPPLETAVVADQPGDTAAVPAAKESSTEADIWWQRMQQLCGKAYLGTLVSADAADADLADQAMVMHARRCQEDSMEIPFHIGDNRSRTWVLTRTAEGVKLEHDHRHSDGSPDVVTLYGGHTRDQGSADVQSFPADEYSKKLFLANGLEASVDNVWSMEIVPGERFSYILRRPERHFQADFDLGEPVESPPAPWGATP